MLLVAGGCGETETEPADTVEAPEPVAPLEVSTPEEPETAEGVDPPEAGDPPAPGDSDSDAPETMESLRARVAELEAQLASCQGATTPEGVEVPNGGADTDAPPAERTAARSNAAETDETPRRRGLIDTLLGPEDRANTNRRRDEPETLELPDPTRILLGP